jgi:hypothetical protein
MYIWYANVDDYNHITILVEWEMWGGEAMCNESCWMMPETVEG